MKRFLIYLFLLSPILVKAGKTDTIQILSSCNDSIFNCLAVFPDAGFDSLSPVVILLHGWGGDYNSWVRNSGKLPELADKYGTVFLAPDAGNSWYFDKDASNAALCGESIAAIDLISFARRTYDLAWNRERTAICGNSMGGHGAIHIAKRYPDVFGYVGSMSGVMYLGDSKIANNIREQFAAGDSLFLDTASAWANSQLLQPFSGNIYLDCGMADHLYHSNVLMQNLLNMHQIGHVWMSRPGQHDWRFWNESIEYFMVFLDERW